MIDSTFYGVCGCRRHRTGQYKRRSLPRWSARPRYYHPRTPRRRTTRRRCRRRARAARQPPCRRRSIFYISPRPRVN